MNDKYKNIAKQYDRIIEPLIRGLKVIGLEMYPVNHSMTLLDIGCGTGSLLNLYQKYTSKIFGIDLSPSMIKVARDKLGKEINLNVGNATNLEFGADQFDVITCSFILHEVSHTVRLELLKEAKRVLQNNGRILLIDYHTGPIKKIRGVFSKLIITFFEFFAGKEHYKNYREFIKGGGVPLLIQKLGLTIEDQKILSGGNFGIFVLRR